MLVSFYSNIHVSDSGVVHVPGTILPKHEVRNMRVMTGKHKNGIGVVLRAGVIMLITGYWVVDERQRRVA